MTACAALSCGEREAGTVAMRPIFEGHVFPARDAEGAVIASGRAVSALDLDEGRMGYVSFCASCHGLDGDGKGPAAKGLDPPPRDFRAGDFKFAAVRSGEPPNDDDLVRVIRGGLAGTAMPPWDLPERDVRNVVSFLKTFAGSRAGQPTGEPLRVTTDPWAGRAAEAARAGEDVYHHKAQCSSCHPSYVAGSLRGSVPMAADRNPYGVELRPPDFTRDTLRSVRAGHELGDTYRVIAAGVGGVMPAWVDALPQDELWALTHYVRSLARK